MNILWYVFSNIRYDFADRDIIVFISSITSNPQPPYHPVNHLYESVIFAEGQASSPTIFFLYLGIIGTDLYELKKDFYCYTIDVNLYLQKCSPTWETLILTFSCTATVLQLTLKYNYNSARNKSGSSIDPWRTQLLVLLL